MQYCVYWAHGKRFNAGRKLQARPGWHDRMKLIDISTPKHPNTFAMVDDEDFERISAHHWYAVANPKSIYPRRKIKGGDSIHMQNDLLCAPDKMVVDHIDGNTLNNQKSNLRICTIGENARNRGKQSNNKSSLKGVVHVVGTQRFRARITIKGKIIHLGCYGSVREASKAYDAAAEKYHGEFARLNGV